MYTTRKELKSIFPNVKINIEKVAKLRWKLSLSGEYEESMFDDYFDVLREDFEYVFEYCKLDCEW